MVILENFKIELERGNFTIYELIERDEYEKTDAHPMPQKTGNKITEWKDIESYHGKLKNALKRLIELAIEKGFEDMETPNDLRKRITEVEEKIDSIFKIDIEQIALNHP